MANITYCPLALDYLRKLGLRISVARRIRKLKQEDLAGITSLSRSTIVEIEKGSPAVSMGNYLTALWGLDLLEEMPIPAVSEVEQQLVADDLPKRVR